MTACRLGLFRGDCPPCTRDKRFQHPLQMKKFHLRRQRTPVGIPPSPHRGQSKPLLLTRGPARVDEKDGAQLKQHHVFIPPVRVQLHAAHYGGKHGSPQVREFLAHGVFEPYGTAQRAVRRPHELIHLRLSHETQADRLGKSQSAEHLPQFFPAESALTQPSSGNDSTWSNPPYFVVTLQPGHLLD